jgi:hypothetical protein
MIRLRGSSDMYTHRHDTSEMSIIAAFSYLLILYLHCCYLCLCTCDCCCARAKIAKALKRGATEALVQFEDDDDETGKTPNRKIAARFIMPMPEYGGIAGQQ